MITLINIVAALVGLGIGLLIGKRREKIEQKKTQALVTYSPSGVILLDGETGRPENITTPSAQSKGNPKGNRGPSRKKKHRNR